jgi:hypothetical protein
VKMPRRLALNRIMGQVLWPSYSRHLGRDACRWANEMGLSNAHIPKPLQTMLLDARVYDARHLQRPEGGCMLSFALSCHDREAEVLVLVHDYASRIS